MSFTEITPYDGQLPSSNDPASFDGRASALMSWLVANFAPEIQALAVEIATALNGEEDTLAAVQALAEGLGSAAAYNARDDEDMSQYPNALPTRAAVAAAIASMGGNQSGSAPVFGVRAWVDFSVSGGVVTINGSGNIDSVVRDSAGNYTVNFSTALPSGNYAVSGVSRTGNISEPGIVHIKSDASKTASSCGIYLLDDQSGVTDPPRSTLMFVG